MDTVTVDMIIRDLHGWNAQLRVARDQFVLLNNSVHDLKLRYERAVKANNHPFREALQYKLRTAEGVRDMFYHYMSVKEQQIDAHEYSLDQAGVDMEMLDQLGLL